MSFSTLAHNLIVGFIADQNPLKCWPTGLTPEELQEKYGVDEWFHLYRDDILEKIFEDYPELKAEYYDCYVELYANCEIDDDGSTLYYKEGCKKAYTEDELDRIFFRYGWGTVEDLTGELWSILVDAEELPKLYEYDEDD